jgi:hypothetical protein
MRQYLQEVMYTNYTVCVYWQHRILMLLFIPHSKNFNVNICAGMIGDYVIWQYVVEDPVRGVYCDFLELHFHFYWKTPLHVLKSMWFQHNTAPLHFAQQVSNWLDDNFLDRWIGHGGPITWTLQCPDLTSPPFWFLSVDCLPWNFGIVIIKLSWGGFCRHYESTWTSSYCRAELDITARHVFRRSDSISNIVTYIDCTDKSPPQSHSVL